jgi:hypothetical protein
MAFGDGSQQALTANSPTSLTADMTVVRDGSYRVVLTDRDGLSDPRGTEYFIRTLEDRPPDVHIVQPASDRSVTPLEEIDIEARADDDFGIEAVELVYSVRGEQETAITLPTPTRAASVTARHTLYLEDLRLQPGDFVSYHVRARDISRGRHSKTGRSDIFFLQVKPFEQEFALAQSQSMAGSGFVGSIEDLVNAQKQIVVSTWKLDRRSQDANGVQSGRDVKLVGRAEAELKTRVEETASSFRESSMRDPRRRGVGRGDGVGAGDITPEEHSMTAAAEAMGRAVAALDELKTSAALPPEMQALNALLKAQAEVKQRQITRQQSAQGGPGNNNRNYDISTLFDRELQRSQQTNYETRRNAERPQDAGAALQKIDELARRQDELVRRQQALADQKLADDELKRQLETLTREQSELRRSAEELAHQLRDEQKPSGQQSQSVAQAARQLRDASEEMRNATSDLRRQDSAQASVRAGRALQKLREVERQLRATAGGTDERYRALGDAQLEARQLADAERQMASALSKSPGKEQLRGLAAEQERLADRLRRMQQDLRRPSTSDVAAGLEQQRIAERMRNLAEPLRAERGLDLKQQAAAQQDMGRELDKLADRLRAAAVPRDAQSQQLPDQLKRARELKSRIDDLTRQLEERREQNASEGLARLRDEYMRQLQETRRLVDEIRRQDPAFAQGGAGLTFEGQGMTFSAPGTESFKQDFAKWEELRRQATEALARVESSVSKALQKNAPGDRLPVGVVDRPPQEYQAQVDVYFKALASRKKP